MKISNLLKEQQEKDLTSFGFEEIHQGKINVGNQSITSLKGAPREVGGDFWCNHNKLTSLQEAPKKVGGEFLCSYNELTSLLGSPEKIGGNFDCSNNELTSLLGSPEKIGGNFDCSNNELTSLKDTPREVGGSFWGSNNKLTSLEGAPREVGGYFSVETNKLQSLQNIHKVIKKINGNINLLGNPIKSHVLGLLLIEGIVKIYLDNEQVEKILNKHLSSKDIFECQEELIDAGFEEYAQL